MKLLFLSEILTRFLKVLHKVLHNDLQIHGTVFLLKCFFLDIPNLSKFQFLIGKEFGKFQELNAISKNFIIRSIKLFVSKKNKVSVISRPIIFRYVFVVFIKLFQLI